MHSNMFNLSPDCDVIVTDPYHKHVKSYLMYDWYLLIMREGLGPSGDQIGTRDGLHRLQHYADTRYKLDDKKMMDFWDRTRGVRRVQTFRKDTLPPSSG